MNSQNQPNENAASKDQLRVGVVGLGMGRNHIPNYNKHPNAQVTALCDLNPQMLTDIAAEHDVPHRFTDAQALFKSGQIDAVSIATPNAFHAPLTIAALEAGLHVLCEKPMAMSAQQAQEMLEAAKANDRKLAIHYNHRQAPNVQIMGRYVKDGAIGQPYFARTVWHRQRGIPARESFLNKKHSGGGCLIDLGVHIIDIALYLLNFPKVLAVSGQIYKQFHHKDVPNIPMDVEDFASAYVRCENNITLSVEVSWASHHDQREQMLTSVYGTEGGLTRRVESYNNIDIQLHKRELGATVTTHVNRFPDDCPSVQEDFIDAILEDRAPACSGQHGHLLMQILDALYESANTGREVALGQTVEV